MRRAPLGAHGALVLPTPLLDPWLTARSLTDHVDLLLVPVAGSALLAEAAVLGLRRRAVDVRDSATSVCMGLCWAATRMLGGKALLFGAWLWTWHHAAPFRLDVRNPLTWVAYWLVGDLVYYGTHRAEHRLRVLWSSHLVHHSSEQMTLATAVRMPWTEVFYKPVIALWAPLLGFHPAMYVTFGALSLMVGQWQHTTWFPRVRWLDGLVMSPSNHRVHHAKNSRYIDKNFGGSLVVWDRLFGTYEPEVEQPVYGVLHLPAARTVLGRSLGGYRELWQDCRAAGSLRGAAALCVGPPR